MAVVPADYTAAADTVAAGIGAVAADKQEHEEPEEEDTRHPVQESMSQARQYYCF